MRNGHSSCEAPTHLGSHQLPIEWLPGELDDGEPPTRAARPAPRTTTESTERSFAQPVPHTSPGRNVIPRARRVVTERATERSVVRPVAQGVARSSEGRAATPAPADTKGTPAPVVAAGRSSTATPAPVPAAGRSSTSTPAPATATGSGATPVPADPASHSTSAASAERPAAAPSEPPSSARGSDPAIAPLPDGMGAIDPMQIPVPPELAAPIYSWVRRLALQADLAGADRVLRDALADMTSSLTVSIVYPGADGLWTLGPDDEIPRDPQPIVAVGRARRAVIASHTALIPVLTSSEVIAVVVLTRNPRNPGYHPMEQMAAIALARESAAILHHLAVQHLQSAAEIEADKGGLYRGEALEAHRTRGSEGVLVQLSPAWVRRTYPLLVATLLIGIVASIFITVPTYSSGHGYIKFEGTPVVAPLGGNVEKVLVQRGQQVKRGTLLAKLNSAQEAIALTQATRDYENAMYQYLVDQTDEQTKKTLAGALTQMERAQATEEQRLVRAPVDGTVSDVRVALGTQLNPGDSMMTIVAPGTEPEVVAFLPGKDRPRLRNDMEMQVELNGFTKGREHVKLTSISTEIVSGEEIMRQILGPKLAESFRQLNGGTWVIVKGRLPSRTFRADNETHFYYHGLTARTEVKIKDKAFLLTLLPALEKIVP